jgi:2-polyprenyl-6-methoxyphenol hydroxylase-like FAD-dependent oxidoreductase
MNDPVKAQCCIVGGGPAGMMSGYLLARAGVEAVVIEKHADFLRDFRGDTIHPSTLQVMDELGLYDRLLSRPHQAVTRLKGRFGQFEGIFADFSHLSTRANFLVFMPQWHFLDFMAEEARAFAGFRLMMETEVTGLIQDDRRVGGVVARTRAGEIHIETPLVLGCDGRRSTVRRLADLEVEDVGAPMDVLWFRLSRQADDPEEVLGSFGLGHALIMINRGDYWQCGYVIAKGALAEVRRRGVEAFRKDVEELAPFLRGRASEVTSLDEISLLTVKVDRLREWARPGLLCLGDAAHAMSPVGGVGINLAIQDAVAAANLLAEPLSNDSVSLEDLQSVQARREPPARQTQWLQVRIQNTLISGALGNSRELKPPLVLRIMQLAPWLTRIPARVIGLGFRPEHVKT